MTIAWRTHRWIPLLLLAIIVVAGAFALFPALRIAAQDPLGVFRVQRFATVTVDPSTLPAPKGAPDPTGMGSLTIQQMPGVTTSASVKDAQSMVDFAVRVPKSIPSGLENPSKIAVTKEGKFSYTFDLKKAQTYLASLGIAGIELPASLNGATITATIPSQVMIEYRAQSQTGPSLILSQGRSPVLEAPPGLDVDLLRRQMLALPVLPPELKSQLEAIQDWQHTAVIPLPRQGATSKEVSVDGGMKGLYVEGTGGEAQGLLWEKNGVIYGITGGVTPDQFMAAANSLAP